MFPHWSRRTHPETTLPGGAEQGPETDGPREPDPTARRALGLLALLELSEELGVPRDPSGIADAALFNLLGQYGCTRGALWLLNGGEGPDAVPLRAQGVPAELAVEVGERWARWFRGQGAGAPDPVVVDRIARLSPPPPGVEPAQRAELAVLAPMTAGERVIGILALGPRVGAAEFGAVELEMLRTSLNLLALTMENTTLRNRDLENRRRLRAAAARVRELETSARETTGSTATLRSPVRPTRGELRGVLASIHDERRPGVIAELRELDFSSAADVPPAMFDPDVTKRVVDAMLDDAVRRAPCGARIRLRLEHGADSAGAWVAVEVRDDGPGLPPERLRGIFAGGATGPGGLSLAEAKRLAESMGARVSADSDPERGTVLTLRLPAA